MIKIRKWWSRVKPSLIHRYILSELVPQFFIALCMLSSVLVVSQLVRLTEILIGFGITLENLFFPFLFITLPFLSFTIPMAVLFSSLLTFSRLSSDGEFTALLASGYSLKRASMPVLILAFLSYVAAAFCASYLEPWGRREMVAFYQRKAQTELDHMLRFKLQSGVFLEDFLGYVLYAEQISPDRTRLENVLMGPGKNSEQKFTLLAPAASILGSVEKGDLRMSFEYGVMYAPGEAPEFAKIQTQNVGESSILRFKKAEMDLLKIFQQQILGEDQARVDYRSLGPVELSRYVDKMPRSNEAEEKLYWKARYLFHQRVSTPFAAIIFACFALVLGVQDQRKAKSWSYASAIGSIVGAYVLMMAFKWFAEQGYLSAPVAAWLPNVLLFSLAGFLMYQKNRLPPSESTLDPAHFPFAWYRVKKRLD